MPPETYEERRRNAPPSAPAAGFQKDLMQDGAAADIDENTRRFPITLAQGAVAASVTGTTTETTLASITIPAGLVGANGQVEIITLWSMTNSANTKTLRVKFGGTVFYSAGQTTIASVQTYTRIANRNSEASQVSQNNGAGNFFGTSTAAPSTGTVDTSQDVVVAVTGQLANSGETLTLESYLVRVLPLA